MSQINLHEIIQQQQEQLAAIQVQIQALLTEGAGGAGRQVGREKRRERGAKVAKPQIFDGILAKVEGFITACMLWNTWDLTFYFSFIYFSFDFIFLFLFFFFSFRTMKKARDKDVT